RRDPPAVVALALKCDRTLVEAEAVLEVSLPLGHDPEVAQDGGHAVRVAESLADREAGGVSRPCTGDVAALCRHRAADVQHTADAGVVADRLELRLGARKPLERLVEGAALACDLRECGLAPRDLRRVAGG